MILPVGVTGFFQKSIPPELDFKNFQQYCYSVREFPVLEISNQKQNNYFCAKFADFYLLLNKYYPFAGAVKVLSAEKIFINISFPEFFAYQFLPAEFLNSPFDFRNHQLSKAELQQILYWNPVSVGNIIFNEWD
ncbi:MAG: hypothetical protein IJJ69_08815 [Oscillospiraceae bacterium]|nr:hypothetical protein [Oscillospiraceae bacterium]